MSANGQTKDAHILSYPPPKCFLSDFTGGFHDNTISCKDLAQDNDEFLSLHQCNCTDMWDPQIHTNLMDGFKEGVTLYSFVPDEWFVVNTTEAVLVLQIYFDCRLAFQLI